MLKWCQSKRSLSLPFGRTSFLVPPHKLPLGWPGGSTVLLVNLPGFAKFMIGKHFG